MSPLRTAIAPWLEMVAPFLPLIWRLALAGAIFWAGWHYGGREAEADLERFKVAQAQATTAAVNQLAADVATRDASLAKKELDNAKAIAELKAEQSARPARVVRVCPDAGPRAVPVISGVAGDDAADGGRAAGLRAGTGFDIGPGVDSLAKRANVVLAKCLHQEERADGLAAMKGAIVPSR